MIETITRGSVGIHAAYTRRLSALLLAATLSFPARPALAATTLVTGDVVVVGMQCDDPDSFRFVPLRDIEAGTTIHFTDNGWTGSAIRSGEGTVTYTVPTGGISAGTNVLWSGQTTGNWSGTAPNLSASGDQILVYQGTAGSPTFIFAVQCNSDVWQSGSDDSNQSDLPSGLTDNATAVAEGTGTGVEDEWDNIYYSGSTTSGTRTVILAAVASDANWTGNNTSWSGVKTANFTVTDGTTPSVTNDNTGTPAAGSIPAGTSDAVLFGFRLSPSGSVDFTGLSLATTGTATSADLANFEVVYDNDSSGTYNAGDSIVSSAAQALADPISFTITGQTAFSAARRYLVIADVAGGATVGRTFTGNIAAANDVTTTGIETGTASGNQQIVTNSLTPLVAFREQESDVLESDSAINIAITLASAADATVNVARAGSATYTDDYTLSATTVVFSAGGATTATISLTTSNDTAQEQLETIDLTLANAAGATIGNDDEHTVFLRDTDSFTILTANLISGTNIVVDVTPYDKPGERILQAMRPDIVAIQEWVFTDSTARAWVDRVFNTNFSYYIEEETGLYNMPNGVISRHPITDSGAWTDSEVANRDFVWATIDVPGPRDLHVVSVHFDYGDGAPARENEAKALTNYIVNTAGWPGTNLLVVAGDLNISNQSETALAIMKTVVEDDRKPADQNSDEDTNRTRTRRYDYVMPAALLNSNHLSVVRGGETFAEGMVFDTGTWGGSPPAPALAGDSDDINMAHMAVMKRFAVPAAGPTIDAPVALPAIYTNTTSFTSAWQSVSNATGYYLDVSVQSNFFASGGFGTILDEDFDATTTAPAGWTNGGTANDTDSAHYQSAPNCRAFGISDTLITPTVNYPSNISFYVDSSSGGAGSDGTIEYKVGTGSWTSLGSFTVGTAGATESFDLTSSPDLTSSESVSFRFASTFNTWYLDDVLIEGALDDVPSLLPAYSNRWVSGQATTNHTVTGLVSSTTYYYRVRATDGSVVSLNSDTIPVSLLSGPALVLTVAPISLAFGNIEIGSTSNKQYTLTGTNLTAAATITTPTGFTVSTQSGSGFTNALTVPHVGGIISTNLYVRFAPAAEQAYSGSVTNASAGATNKLVAVSGTGTQATTPIPLLTLSAAALAFGDVRVGSTSNKQYTLTGTNLTAAATITTPAGFTVSTQSGSGFTNALTVPHVGGIISTGLYVRFAPLAPQAYAGSATNASTGATNKLMSVSGTGVPIDAPVVLSATYTNTVSFTSAWQSVVGATGYYLDVATQETFSAGGGGELVSNGDCEAWTGGVPDDWDKAESVTEETTTVHAGSSSVRQQAGTTDLSQDVSGIVGGQEYTIRYYYLDNDANARTRIWSYWLNGASTLSDNATELRPGTYSSDAAAWQEWSQTLTAPATADGFRFEVRAYNEGAGSGDVYYDDFSIQAGGAATPSYVAGYSNLWVSGQASTNQAVTGLVAGATYYYRVRAADAYTTSAHSGTQRVGTVTAPTPGLAMDVVSLAFGDVRVGSTSNKQYTLTASNLTTGVTITTPVGFVVSTKSGSDFTNALSVPHSGGDVNTNIYVRFAPALVQSYSGSVTNTSAGAASKLVSVSGTGTAIDAPVVLPADPTNSLDFGARWEAVSGATGYRLDVATNAAFSEGSTLLYSEDFSGFEGAGLTSSPSATQLDSDEWKVLGMSDGDTVFGGGGTSGDFARGTSTGGETTGGIYGFDVSNGGVEDRALGVQPTSSDWVPGSFVLKFLNTSGATLTSVDVSYRICVLNDGDRAGTFSFSHSSNDTSYTSVGALDYTSTAAADVSPTWQEVNRSTTLSGLSITNNGYYYLKWTGHDSSGTGARDELALDDVTVSTGGGVSYVPGYSNLWVAGQANTNYSVSGLSPGSTYYYRVRAATAATVSANSATQRVDTIPASTNSDIIRTISGGFSEPENIAYAAYVTNDITVGNSIEAAKLRIRDGGAAGTDADSLATVVEEITFSIANHAHLQRVALYDGTTEKAEVAAAATISFTNLAGVAANDNGTMDFFLRVSFHSNVTDNAQFAFTISNVMASATGSTFSASDAGGAASSTIGDRNRIEVTATKLVFSYTPTEVGVSNTFPVAVRARDGNENQDLDSAASVTIEKASGSGALSGGAAQALSSGAGSWNNLSFDEADTYTLTATDGAGGLADGTSANIVATFDEVTVLFQGFEGEMADNWAIASGSSRISDTIGAGDTPANQRVRTDSFSWQVSDAGTSLVLDDSWIFGYHDCTVRVHVSSTATTAAQGAEASDYVEIRAAANGDDFRSKADVIVRGFDNNTWSNDNGRIAATILGQTVSGTNYSVVTIAIPNGTHSIALKITARNSTPTERWNIDDISLTGFSGTGTDTNPPIIYETSIEGFSGPVEQREEPWINEVDYNNPGIDTGEWVEIVGPAGVSLDDYECVFINSVGDAYGTTDLSTAGWTFSDESGGFGFFVFGSVAASYGVAPDHNGGANWTSNMVQNGPGDSILLRRISTGEQVFLLDYDGDNAATDEDSLASSDDSSAALSSLFLTGGPGATPDSFSWSVATGVGSPGAPNSGQSLSGEAGALTLTDEALYEGGYSVTARVQDVWSGMVVSNEAGYAAPAYFYIVNTNNEVVVSNTFPSTASNGTWRTITLATVGGTGTYDRIVLGTNRLFVVGAQYHANEIATTSSPIAFLVVDDDTNSPSVQGFALHGQTYTPATVGYGIVVTGAVRDADSGVYGINASQAARRPRVQIVRPDGSVAVDDTAFTTGPSNTAATGWQPLSYTMDNIHLTMTGVYTVRVVVTDYDTDRPDDWLSLTNTYTFTSTIDPAVDSDGDGVVNSNEFIAGTDIGNSNAFMRIVSMDPAPGDDLRIGLWVGAAPGRTYRVLGADTPVDPKAPLSGASIDGGAGGTNYWTNANASASTSHRYFTVSVGIGSAGYTNVLEWGMHVQAREADARYLVSVPVDYGNGARNSLDGPLGAHLAGGLYAGTTMENADRIKWRDADNAWHEFWLFTNASQQAVYWSDGAAAATNTVAAGQAIWVICGTNGGARSECVFGGMSYTDSSKPSFKFATTNNGWTAFGWPLAVSRHHVSTNPAVDQLGFVSAGGSGGTATHPSHTNRMGDRLWVWQDNSWQNYWLMDHVGGGYDGRWWDFNRRDFADITLEIGKAYYYHHTTNYSGAQFNWTPEAP